jgi:molybdopterin molybdotransferase
MIEDVEFFDRRCHVKERGTETHIRVQGEDVRRGEILLASGSVLTAGAISLLAGIGHTEPLVTRQPAIIHFTTGDELVPARQKPGPGQIRDSNTPLVAAFFRGLSLAVIHHHLPEDFDQAKAELARYSNKITAADILIFSGGASVGAHDHTSQLLEMLGFELKIRGTRLRPGKPLLFASSNTQLAFGLPGNPLAHFVGLLGFVRPAIAKLTGTTAPGLQPAILSSPLQAGGNPRETLWPASLSLRDGMLSAEPLRWSNSGDLATLARSNGLILLAPGTDSLNQSTRVNVLPCALFP